MDGVYNQTTFNAKKKLRQLSPFFRQAMLAARHTDDKTTHPLPARMSADSSTVSKTDDSELDVVGTADSPRPSLHPPTPIASSINHSGMYSFSINLNTLTRSKFKIQRAV